MLERTALLISVKHDLEGKRRGMACALSRYSGSEEMPDFSGKQDGAGGDDPAYRLRNYRKAT